MWYSKTLLLSVLLSVAPPVMAMAETNIAFGATVKLNGIFFQGGYPGGILVDPQTVVDGHFLPQYTYWQQGGVWWHEPVGVDQNIALNLKGEFLISSLTVQVDDNDAYELYYRKGSTAPWLLMWDIPSYDFYLGQDLLGMQSRPNPYDDFSRYILDVPVLATELMLKGGSPSDFLYSVSEIQAFGRPIAEPQPLLLLSAGLASLLVVTARRSRYFIRFKMRLMSQEVAYAFRRGKARSPKRLATSANPGRGGHRGLGKG